MAKKNILKIDSEIDFVLTGIISSLPDYRLCWYLNGVLALNFAKAQDIAITLPELHIQQSFSRFVFEEEITMSAFWVIQNKAAGNFLLPELKQVDYLFMIKGNYYRTKIRSIEKLLKSIMEIQAIIPIDTSQLKNGDRLIF